MLVSLEDWTVLLCNSSLVVLGQHFRQRVECVAVAGVHAHLQQEGVRHALPWQVHTLRDRTCSLMITVDHMKLRF